MKITVLSNGLTDRHHATLIILAIEIANIMKQNWNQFLLAVKTKSSLLHLRQAAD